MAVKKGLFHKGINPFQYFVSHKMQLLRQHGILRAYEQKLAVVAHGPRQRCQIWAHNHFPVQPELLQPRPALALTGGRTKTSQHRGHNFHGGYGLRIFLALAINCHHGSGRGWVWLAGVAGQQGGNMLSAGLRKDYGGPAWVLTGAQNELIDYMQIS